MHTYDYNIKFGSDLMAKTEILAKPFYGAKINVLGFPNCLVCVNGHQVLEGCCINKQPTLFKKVDPATYTLSFITPLEKEGIIAGNTFVDVDTLNDYTAKFFYPCTYAFQVGDANLFINSFLENNTCITVDKVTKKINQYIANAVKETISLFVKKYGIIEFDNYLTRINEEIGDKIKNDLNRFGLRINHIDLHLSKLDEDVQDMSNMKKLQDQSIKEDTKCLD